MKKRAAFSVFLAFCLLLCLAVLFFVLPARRENASSLWVLEFDDQAAVQVGRETLLLSLRARYTRADADEYGEYRGGGTLECTLSPGEDSDALRQLELDWETPLTASCTDGAVSLLPYADYDYLAFTLQTARAEEIVSASVLSTATGMILIDTPPTFGDGFWGRYNALLDAAQALTDYPDPARLTLGELSQLIPALQTADAPGAVSCAVLVFRSGRAVAVLYDADHALSAVFEGTLTQMTA